MIAWISFIDFTYNDFFLSNYPYPEILHQQTANLIFQNKDSQILPPKIKSIFQIKLIPALKLLIYSQQIEFVCNFFLCDTKF